MSALRNHMVLILLALFFTGLSAHGQNVTKLEYFFDADPGFGKATSVTLTPGQDVTASFSVDIAALSTGFHSLYVRGYSTPYQVTQNGSTVTKGGWSLTNVRSFYKESVSNLGNAALSPVTAGEYFVDKDPGTGKGTSIPVTQGTDLTNLSFAFDITALSKGFHTLYVRFKDAKGSWSMTNVRSFYKEALTGNNNVLADVTKGEYFFDADPGFGNGKNISFTAGKDLTNISFTVDVTALATGFHQLYTRFRDANGLWSYTANRSLYKETVTNNTPGTLAKIAGGEYFIDTDPGPGKGLAVSLTQSADISNLAFTADISTIQKGFHQLYVRFKDANGVWGFTSNRSFYKEAISGTSAPLAKIVRLEYFVDNDPGFGKGNKVTVTPTLNDSLSFFMDMTNVSIGNHKVFVRSLDESGAWSLVSSGDFKINPPADLIIKIGEIGNTVCAGSKYAVPYSVNGPFGSNNIFTVQLSDINGNFANPKTIGTLTSNTADTIQATIPAGTSAGNNYRIRLIASSPLDTSGASAPFSIQRVPEAYAIINGTTPVCLGSSTYTISPADPSATVYNWSVSGGGTLDTTKGTSVKMAWTASGVFIIKATAANACGNGAEKTLSVRVYAGKPIYGPTITANGSTLSATRTPSIDSVYAYKWYKDSVAIPNATSSSYSASQDGRYTVAYINPCGEGPMSNAIQFIANKQSQTISFTQVADQTYGQVSYVKLSATATSGLPVTYSLLQGSGSIKSDTLYFTNAGSFKLRASQAGNLAYAPATADMTFEVKKAVAQLVLSNLTQVYNGSAKQATVTTTPSGLSVSLTYNGTATAPVNAATYKVVATINNTNYQGADSASFVIQKAPQTITLAKVPDLPLSTANYKITATASSGLPVSLSLTASPIGSVIISNDTLYTKGAGTGYLVVTQAGNANYNAAPTVKDTFDIRKATQNINFPAISDKTWGSAAFVLNATATSGLAVSYRIVSGPATLNGSTLTLTGLGIVVVEASQAGNGIFNAAVPVQRSFAVVAYPDLYVQNVTSDKNSVGPNDSVTVSWKVSNIGAGQSLVKWTERIYMQSTAGANKTTISLINYTNAASLDTGKTISRSAVIAVPASLNIGDQGYFVVELVPDTAVHEQAGNLANNTAVQGSPWSVKKLLTLDLSANQINEGATAGITGTISRSGSLENALTANITAKYPQRFTLPASVTIPAGQAGTTFSIAAPDNNVVEGNLLDTVQVSATGFTSDKEPLMLVENDQASLTLSNVPAQVNEGDSVKFNLSTNLKQSSPLTVYLTSGNSKKLVLPATVVIPAGSQAVSVGVLISQNTTPEVDQVIELKAGAANHNPAMASLTIKDDDLPSLELVLQTNTVSEGAGFYATQATLRRTSTGNPQAFTVNLSASVPNSLILPGSITLAASENEKTFNIGVVDNTLVEGQRQVAITASVFIASCGCSALPTSSGSVSAALTINDNDGPTLTLSATPLTLPEGAPNAGLLRITRNTSTAASLTVNLSTSDSSEATLPATAIIPAGKSFVDVAITTINDGITDGSQTVYFGAKATGFSAGSVWVMVTDQNKPDLLVQSASLGDSSVQALNLFNYNVSVRNNGFATAPTGVVVHGYLSKDDVIDETDTLVTRDTLSVAIPAGQSAPVLNATKAPNKPGKYKLLFEINPDGAMTELLLTNNTAPALPLTIKPDYTATANVQPVYVQQGDTVRITGTATKANGLPAAVVPVEVYVITGSLRRTMTATTNGSGQYTAAFVPMRKEAGHYSVGASFPGMGLTDEQDAFDILGVRINSGLVPQIKTILNDTLKGSLTVENLSTIALTNFTLKPLSLPNGAVMAFTPIASLAGNGSAKLNYTILGKALSAGNNFEAAQFEAVSNQGLKQGFDVLYFCQAPNAYVVSDAARIDVAVSSSVGERLVSFKLINKGQGSTGALNINLPQASWLSNVTPKSLPSLATGDTALVVLKFRATADVPFNVPVNSSIGIQVQNGNSFTLPFTFEKKAESKGVVIVNATDQFTFYSEGAPKVKGARVQIKNYFSGAVYADGVTGEDGVFKATGVPEGKHRIVVEKEKHQSSDGTVEVNPGDTTETSVFLNYKAIEYSWSVVPTAVQDQYDITLNAQFETHVPMPVVTIEMPKTMPQLSGSETYAFNVTLTNHGLIAAKDVTLGLPQSDPEYEFVTNYVPADLMAQQSIQVPVIMRRRTQGIAGAQANGISIADISRELGIAPVSLRTAGANIKCTDYADVQYWYKCSLSTGLWEKGGTLFSYSGRACFGGGITEAIIEYDPKPYGGGPQKKDPPCAICPEILVGNGTGPTFEFKEEKKSCMDCIIDMFKAAGTCLGIGPGSIKTSGSVGDKIQKIRDLYGKAKDYYGKGQSAICVIKAAANGDAGGVLKCVPLPDPPGLPCAKAIGQAALTCMNTGVAGGGGSRIMMDKNGLQSNTTLLSDKLRTMGTAGALEATGGLGNEVFRQISTNFDLSTRAFEFRSKWAQEYFGSMANSDAFPAMALLIDPYVENLDSIRTPVQNSVLAAMEGYEITQPMIQAFFTRWNTSVAARKAGVLKPNAQYPDIIDWTLVKACSDSIVKASDAALALGYESVGDLYIETFRSVQEIWEGQSSQAACASVTVQFSQKLTMTREAFEGTLNIFNGHPTDKMDSLSVNIQITDEAGVPSNGLFQINTKSLTNLSDVTGTGQIAGQGTGTVKFLFIPELGAAPTEPKRYNFGGNIRYFDPYQKQIVTMPMSNVILTVNPSPNLMLHYFMQRNILGDDALTSPDIEPSEPAELAVMVENQGYGPAVNMTISSAQPKVVENEKGLAINFNLIGSNFQGQPRKLGVTDINFGTIPGRETRIGQWYFTSSLLGKFVGYDAKLVHANSFGNPELSLVKGVKLHELTKSMRAYAKGEDNINDFLVNDIFDIDDLPDAIYFSQGVRTENVYKATSGSFDKSVSGPAYTNLLTVTASKSGWNFVKINDPGSKRYELVSVTRNSDGKIIPLDNAWLTFVTLPSGRAPVYENKFHFVDSFATQTPVSYTVVWKPKNMAVPKVVKVEGAPEATTTEQVKKLTVVFDKAIDASTFTKDDLTLTLQGGQNIINSSVVIKALDTATFEVDLSGLTGANGFFAFTAQAAGVKDIYGISGTVGKQVTWTQFLNVPAVQSFTGLPEGNKAASYDTIGVLFNMPVDAGTVTPQRFIITKDGMAQSGSVKIDSVRSDKKLFYLSGLGNILTTSGEYQFTVDLPNIKSATNVAGTAQQSVKLTLDNSAPTLVSLSKVDSGGLDAQHIPFVRLQFNEDVVGLNTSALKLTRNGLLQPVTYDMLIMLDNKNWLAGNFGMLTYPDGAYTLTLDMSGVKDAIGNTGTGTQSISWTANRAALITISNLAVSPDLGYLNSDGITASDSLMVAFNLNKPASKITLSQVDLSGETLLATVSDLAAGAVSIPVKGLKAGNSSLRITATGANGGSTTATRSLYIDHTPLSGQWQFTSGQMLKQQVDTIPFQLSAKLLSTTGLLNAVQLKRNDVALPSTGLVVKQINDTLYQLSGLRQVSNTAGSYQLFFNLQMLKKYSSGMSGIDIASVNWTVLNPNKTPVAVAGKDTLVRQTGALVLNGSASYDPDGSQLTYRWLAPQGIKLNDSTVAKPSFTVSSAYNGNTYPFLLIVSDGDLYATATVNVTVSLCGAEVCNGIDDDCDGLIDEGFQITYYKDNDGDGFGNASQTVLGSQCAPPVGYAVMAGDCDDANAALYPGANGDGCNTCTTDGVTFYSAAGTAFQWQVDDGTGFKNIQENTVYTGTTQKYLQLKQPPTSWSGYKYRCLVTNNGIQNASPVRVLKFTFTWKGTVSSAWENPQNWSCNKVPDQYTDVQINNTTPVVISSAASAKSVTLGANSKITIGKGATLNVRK